MPPASLAYNYYITFFSVETIIEELTKIVRGDVCTDPSIITERSEDKSPFHITPLVVIFPRDAADVLAVVRYVATHKNQHPELSITARSAGTDVGGGPLGESIILDFTRYCNHFSVEGGHSTAEPGVFYRDFETETLRHNLLLPSYPASRSICALGGMVANNSGGEKTLAYGKTDKYVTSLKVILDDGNEYLLTELRRDELAKKLALQTYEGNFYRALHHLITKNYELLMQTKPHVSKNSAGYALWNVWDPHAETYDVTKLFIGSQGTLGIITEINFRLIQPKKHAQMLVMFTDDINLFPDIVHTVLKQKPEAFEVYDKTVLSIIFKSFPRFVSSLGGNFLKLIRDFIPEFKIIASTLKIPDYILTAEFTGDNPEEILQRIQCAVEDLKRFHVRTHITQGPDEIKKYHTIRRESFALLQQHLRNRQTVTFIDDLIVLPENLPRFIPALREILGAYTNLDYSIIGHIGDGNLHVIPLMDLSDPRSRNTIEKLTQEVNNLVLKFHGSITAEHNDGLVRSPFLKQMYGEEVYKLFEETKQIFDSNNIFNPGKKVHSHFAYALDHLKTHT